MEQSKTWQTDATVNAHALRLFPDNHYVYYRMAQCARKQKDAARAFLLYQKAIALFEGDYASHACIAKLYFNKGNLEKTRYHLERSLTHFPQGEELTLASLGEIYALSNDPTIHDPVRGLELLDRAINMSPRPDYLHVALQTAISLNRQDLIKKYQQLLH